MLDVQLVGQNAIAYIYMKPGAHLFPIYLVQHIDVPKNKPADLEVTNYDPASVMSDAEGAEQRGTGLGARKKLIACRGEVD